MDKNNKNNLQELNEIWKNGVLEDFIKRMLIYYDPMNLIIMGAPYDEYDDYIFKIKKMILQDDITVSQLSDFIFDLYKGDESIIENIKKKTLRMAEDLLELKNG